MPNEQLPSVVVLTESMVLSNRLRRLLERELEANYISCDIQSVVEVLKGDAVDLVVVSNPLAIQPDPLRLLKSTQRSAQLLVFDTDLDISGPVIEQKVAAARLILMGMLPLPCKPESLAAVMTKLRLISVTDSLDRAPIGPDEVRAAIDKGVIQPWYQPKVAMPSGTVVGFEALARWVEPGFPVVEPDRFISIAETEGLINSLTRSVSRQVLAQLAIWQQEGKHWHISVNTSVDDLESEDYVDWISAELDATGVQPQGLIIEVTESRVSKNMPLLLANLSYLRQMGLGVAIDDFGTGYSSLAQLNQMPFTELKIDRAFVTEAHRQADKRVILDNSASIGLGLGLAVVAEGIETIDDWRQAQASGAQVCQGHFSGAPMPASLVPQWLEDWQRRAAVIRSAAGSATPMPDEDESETSTQPPVSGWRRLLRYFR